MVIQMDKTTENLYMAIKNGVPVGQICWDKVPFRSIMALSLVLDDPEFDKLAKQAFIDTGNYRESFDEKRYLDRIYELEQVVNIQDRRNKNLDLQIKNNRQYIESLERRVDQLNRELTIAQNNIHQSHNSHKIVREWTIGQDTADMDFDEMANSTARPMAYVRSVNLKLYDDDGNEQMVHILQ